MTTLTAGENNEDDSGEESDTDEDDESDEVNFSWITSKRVSCIDHSLVRSLTTVLNPTLKNVKYSTLIKDVKTIVKKVIFAIYHSLSLILDS